MDQYGSKTPPFSVQYNIFRLKNIFFWSVAIKIKKNNLILVLKKFIILKKKKDT